MVNGQSRVLQRLDDRRVGVSQFGVFPNEGDGHMFQKTIRPEI